MDSDAGDNRLSKVAIVFMVMVLVILMNALRDFFASVQAATIFEHNRSNTQLVSISEDATSLEVRIRSKRGHGEKKFAKDLHGSAGEV